MLSEETAPLIEKMQDFLEKNPEETALKQKMTEIVAGIQQVNRILLLKLKISR